MFSFPLSVFLIIYLVCILFAGILAVFALYHLWGYGATYRTAALTTAIFAIGVIAILSATSTALSGVDWKTPLTFTLPGVNLTLPAQLP